MHESIPARDDRIIRTRAALRERLFDSFAGDVDRLTADGCERVWLLVWPAPAAAVIRVSAGPGEYRTVRRLAGDELATLADLSARFLASFGDGPARRWLLPEPPRLDRVVVFEPLAAHIARVL